MVPTPAAVAPTPNTILLIPKAPATYAAVFSTPGLVTTSPVFSHQLLDSLSLSIITFVSAAVLILPVLVYVKSAVLDFLLLAITSAALNLDIVFAAPGVFLMASSISTKAAAINLFTVGVFAYNTLSLGNGDPVN